MATGEDQAQALVGNRLGLLELGGIKSREQLRLAPERLLAPDPVDRAVARGRQEPGAGVRRGALARPAVESRREGLLNRVLGQVDVAEDAGEDREGAPPLLPENGLDYTAASSNTTTGRTSIDPCFEPGIFAAQAIASSSDSASIR